MKSSGEDDTPSLAQPPVTRTPRVGSSSPDCPEQSELQGGCLIKEEEGGENNKTKLIEMD